MQRIVRTLAMAAMVACVACGSDDDPVVPTEQSVLGTYTLRSVNGGLPYRLAADGSRLLEIISGSFQFHANHTFTDNLTTRLSFSNGAPPDEQTATQTGTFTLFGNNLALSYPVADTVVVDTVAVLGSAMTRSQDGLVMTYRK